MREDFEKNGFITFPFPEDLRKEMLTHIQGYLRSLVKNSEDSIENCVNALPEKNWQEKICRCFRMFPDDLAQRTFQWAQESFCKPFAISQAVVNVVMPQEVQKNPNITENTLAIYWRCVRPGKPDAGKPHRDASFWDLEFQEGYDPKAPFAFNYHQNCMKIWIPLLGCSPDTTLSVIPRSHKMDIPTIVEQTENGRRPSICPRWLEEQKALFVSPPELSQGSCILFDMNLVHVGPRHHQQTMRLSAEFNFIIK